MTNALERSLETPTTTWSRGALFRLGFVYWGVYCVLILLTNTVSADWSDAAANALGAVGAWVGNAILRISYEINGTSNGSGDKTSDWVLQLCILVLAVFGSTVWSVLDRRRARDAQLREALRIAVRYTLAFSVMGYGITKLFQAQMPYPGTGRLLQRFGDASPMGLLWTFIGASPAYQIFSGAMEVLGAALILFRRTTLLGALVLVGVMTNVAVMNLCYDVPVKLVSAHYLAMALFLLLPDARRLANVIVLDRVAQPVARDLVLPRRWMRVLRRVIKYGAIAVIVFAHVRTSLKYAPHPLEKPATWYDGYWSVTAFRRDGREIPDSANDPDRWTRVRFQIEDDQLWLRWRMTDSAYGYLYDVAIDENAQTIRLTFNKRFNDSAQPKPGLDVVMLHYVRNDAQHITLEGKVGANDISAALERLDTSGMLLVTRGFNWINEEPFNR